MLQINIYNTQKGTDKSSEYIFIAFVNGVRIADGEVKDHDRSKGVADLLHKIATELEGEALSDRWQTNVEGW